MNHTCENQVLIPGGEFQMGSDTDKDHSQVHKVLINSFYIDKYEVANILYNNFCKATGHRLPGFWCMDGFRYGPNFPNHPVVGVSWQDAAAYADWCGKHLPTEAEWEYATRGGLSNMNYPNGNTLDPSQGNYSKSALGGPIEVGSYSGNGFGLYDMQGNVVEWVWDYYDENYYSSSPMVNPWGPETARACELPCNPGRRLAFWPLLQQGLLSKCSSG
ncbi:MAG: SUMF1/EgtB/PvdO family nonheme iron enzyme [Chloroflexota bacterium]